MNQATMIKLGVCYISNLFHTHQDMNKVKTGIFAHRAIVDQARGASATREKLNVFNMLKIEKIAPF